MAWADIAKAAINFGEDVMGGVSGNSKRYAATLGKRWLKSNMSTLQSGGSVPLLGDVMKQALKGDNKTAVMKTLDAAKKGLASKKNLSGKALKDAMHKADFTGVGDVLLAKNHAKHSLGYKLGDALGGGIRDSVRSFSHNKSLSTALKAGFTKTAKDGTTSIRAGRVAGAVMTAGVAGRVASGGGLYRDRYGRVNVPGVPFI